MFTGTIVKHEDNGTFPVSVWTCSEPEIAAMSYKSMADWYLGTSGGSSYAFGQNGSTFMPPEVIDYLCEVLGPPQISDSNLRAINLLEEWFVEPDDLGEVFWKEFDRELEAHTFDIS